VEQIVSGRPEGRSIRRILRRRTLLDTRQASYAKYVDGHVVSIHLLSSAHRIDQLSMRLYGADDGQVRSLFDSAR
jgi:hypothetical protein